MDRENIYYFEYFLFFLIALTKITAVIWWIKNLVRKLEIFNLPFEFFTIFV
jgi:hypothetical protein